MTVVVQRTLTQEYFSGDNNWTPHAQLAFNFEAAAKAADFCHDLHNVHIIVKFSDNRPPFTIPAGKPRLDVAASRKRGGPQR